ncbi:hypothetical protein HUJ04_013370 [Dendroctonus ponderosae]|nr:hypothetical protein HUJ04_013370 [Dendroctonus ponderosae]
MCGVGVKISNNMSQNDLLFIGAHEGPLEPPSGHVENAKVSRCGHAEAFDAHLGLIDGLYPEPEIGLHSIAVEVVRGDEQSESPPYDASIFTGLSQRENVFVAVPNTWYGNLTGPTDGGRLVLLPGGADQSQARTEGTQVREKNSLEDRCGDQKALKTRWHGNDRSFNLLQTHCQQRTMRVRENI